jgi:hypothetical protein
MLQWIGGLGIVIVAIIFLPVMRVGGMQFFHAVSMDISGEIIPRATQIASDLVTLHLAISMLCTLAYAAAGMTAFDAICHMMTTVSTGEYGTSDLSFGKFGPAAQYVSIVFMALSAMPFVRFVELGRGRPRPLWRDTQVRAFLGIIAVAAAIVAAAEIWTQAMPVEQDIRSAFFDVTSVVTTTGYDRRLLRLDHGCGKGLPPSGPLQHADDSDPADAESARGAPVALSRPCCAARRGVRHHSVLLHLPRDARSDRYPPFHHGPRLHHRPHRANRDRNERRPGTGACDRAQRGTFRRYLTRRNGCSPSVCSSAGWNS